VIWEYRGHDASGTYRVHIEFDSRKITTLIAQIPDKTGEALARRENRLNDREGPTK
jgi:hypothetical protein